MLEFYHSTLFIVLTSASYCSVPDIKKLSYLALVIASHQRKPALLSICEHKKTIHEESNVIFDQKLCVKIMKSFGCEINCRDNIYKWQGKVGQLYHWKKIKNLKRWFEHFLVFMTNLKESGRTNIFMKYFIIK